MAGSIECCCQAAFLPAATKLWPRLCFYSCLDSVHRGGFQQGDPPRKGEPPGRENLPWQGCPLARRHPCWGDPPSIRSISGQYASYWNAFLFLIFPPNYSHTVCFFEHLFAINFTHIVIPSNSSFLSKTGLALANL